MTAPLPCQQRNAGRWPAPGTTQRAHGGASSPTSAPVRNAQEQAARTRMEAKFQRWAARHGVTCKRLPSGAWRLVGHRVDVLVSDLLTVHAKDLEPATAPDDTAHHGYY